MYEKGKEIADMLRRVREFLTSYWEMRHDELTVGDIELISQHGTILWDDMIIAHSSIHFVVPPRDALPPELDGFLHLVKARGIWEGVGIYEVEGHEVGKCKGECEHIKRLEGCHSHDMKERMVMNMNDEGDDE